MRIAKNRIVTPLGFVVVVACAAVVFACPANAQKDWSAEVLAIRDTDKKEQQTCVLSIREGVSSEVLAKLTQRERHGPAVALAAGRYFEKGPLDQNTPAVLRALADRPDIGPAVIAYASVSPFAPQLIVGLSSSDRDQDQLIAARMLAATAVMRRPLDREKKRLPEKVGPKSAALNVNYREQVVVLLVSDNDLVLEYTLLAVGLDRIVFAKDAATKHADNKDPAVAMAAQFALAGVNAEVDAEAILKQITRPVKAKRPMKGDPPPGLSYDPRGDARRYAIMAAGRAKLTEAVDPLFDLLGDPDLHTSVAAARALGQIGGEGMPLKLLEAITDQTPWPVRVALYQAIGHLPDKAVIEPLRARFTAEKGRFRQDALYALLSISAGQMPGMTIHDFDAWWLQEGEAFKVDLNATREWRATNPIGLAEVEPIAGFYDSAVISERPVFAVDASLSMKGVQIESLKTMLTDVGLSLPQQVKFNIVDFGGHVRVLAPGGLIPAKNRKRAMQQFIYELELTYATRSFDAIERAIMLPEMDTVHFLSDGAPIGGHVDHWQRIDYVTRLLCRTKPVAIQVVFFPPPGKAEKAAKGMSAKLMTNYAQAHAGRFVISTAE